MKTRFLILIAIAVLPLFSYAFGENQIIEIGIGQTIQLDDFKLYFYDIEDSRCPLDVTCIWEGNVTAMINLDNETLDASTYFTPGLTVTFPPYEIMMIDIQPHPISSEKPDYVATLELSRIQEFTDEDICGIGNALVDGICVPSNYFRDESGEIICKGYTSGGGFLEYPECGPIDQFVIHVLVIVLPIAGIMVGSIIIWRKRK